MKAVYENRLAMANAVAKMLKDNSAKVAKIPALVVSEASLIALIEKIQVQNEQQELDENAAEQKEAAAIAAIDVACTIISAVKAYAKKKGKIGLLGSFNYSRSALLRTPDNQLVAVLTLIKDNATVIAADIEDYGAGAADIAELELLTEEYKKLNPLPRSNRGKKKSATTGLDKSFKEMTILFDEMDDILNTQRTKDSELFTLYDSTRVVGGRKSKPKDDDKRKLKGKGKKKDEDKDKEKEKGEDAGGETSTPQETPES